MKPKWLTRATVSPQYGPSLLSSLILASLSPLHHTCPSLQAGGTTHGFVHTLTRFLLHWCPPPATPLSLQIKGSSPFKPYILADLFDKSFLETLLQNSSLFHLFSKTNLYPPSGHVGFVFIYLSCFGFITFSVLWVDGFHEIGRIFWPIF